MECVYIAKSTAMIGSLRYWATLSTYIPKLTSIYILTPNKKYILIKGYTKSRSDELSPARPLKYL